MNDKQIEALLKAHGIRLTDKSHSHSTNTVRIGQPSLYEKSWKQRFKRLTSQIFSVHYHCSNSNI